MLATKIRELEKKLREGNVSIGTWMSMAPRVHRRESWRPLDTTGSSGAWRAGGSSLQRPLWMHMLSPLVLLQPVWRLRRGGSQTRQRPRADGWKEFINPIVERYLKLAVRLLFRADAAFAKPEIYEYLETRHIGYAIRLPATKCFITCWYGLPSGPLKSPSSRITTSFIQARVRGAADDYRHRGGAAPSPWCGWHGTIWATHTGQSRHGLGRRRPSGAHGQGAQQGRGRASGQQHQVPAPGVPRRGAGPGPRLRRHL